MQGPREAHPVNTRLVIGPNASLTGRQALWFMAGICAAPLTIAGGFAALGFWLILPFAGLELVALGAGLAVCLRRNRYREVVHFQDDVIRLEFGVLDQGVVEIREFRRALTRVWVEPGDTPHSPMRLVMSCGGQRLEFGRCLTDEERVSLAVRMRALISPAWPGTAVAEPGLAPDS